ncbi:MAG TPA: PilZ domain-containing protein [Thermoanaerobaculia bacterium]|nr:PilZ domain-containing protein [Thermoanaerobaculia bacterium]
MNRRDLRTVPRYFLNPPLPAIVNDQLVRLIDLSVKGARVQLDASSEPGQEVVLVIVTDRGNIKVKGEVLWCEIDSLQMDAADDRYLAGVSFKSEIPGIDVLIDELCGLNLAVRIEDSRDHDRYRITAPLTGSFGDAAPVSLLDLSLRGARIATDAKIVARTEAQLRFQIDEESGPISVSGKVIWTTPAINRGVHAGLLIDGEDEVLRMAIHRLCVRGEARIDLDSLRRKFDQLRAQGPQKQMAG